MASIRYGDELIKWRSFGRCIRLVGKTSALVKDMLSREDAKSSSAGVKSSSRGVWLRPGIFQPEMVQAAASHAGASVRPPRVSSSNADTDSGR